MSNLVTSVSTEFEITSGRHNSDPDYLLQENCGYKKWEKRNGSGLIPHGADNAAEGSLRKDDSSRQQQRSQR